MSKPEKITKLAFYLMNKEPLFYLFIINADFILEEATNKHDIASVGYKNSRVKFYYTENFISLPIKQMYFVLIHEAFHIFKKHLMVHKDYRKKDSELINIAEDAIINSEILSSSFEGISPDVTGLSPYFIPDEFKLQYSSLGKDAYVSPRLFNWYKRNQDQNQIKENSFVKNKKTGKYGFIVEKNNKICDVVEADSIEKLKTAEGELNSEVQIDDLIPVFVNSHGDSYNQTSYENEHEVYGFKDNHDRLHEDNQDEIISQEVFSEKIVKQAREMTDNNLSNKTAGINKGNSILETLEKLMKSEINWKKVFRRNINLYYSNNSINKTKKKSILTYLMNAKSRYGMLFRHWIKTKDKLQKYIFIAMDTSGSCFADAYDIERFFTEIDNIATELEFDNSGRVFLMQWDYGVASKWKEYKKNDWKKIVIRGGGGTNPKVIFDYIKKEFKPIGEFSLISNLDEKNQLLIPDKNKMPFLIVLTDGVFWDKMKTEDLGYYENNHKNVLFVTKNNDMLYENAKSILFK